MKILGWMYVKDVAVKLGIGCRQVRRLCTSEVLDSTKINNRLMLVFEESVNKYMRSGREHKLGRIPKKLLKYK